MSPLKVKYTDRVSIDPASGKASLYQTVMVAVEENRGFRVVILTRRSKDIRFATELGKLRNDSLAKKNIGLSGCATVPLEDVVDFLVNEEGFLVDEKFTISHEVRHQVHKFHRQANDGDRL